MRLAYLVSQHKIYVYLLALSILISLGASQGLSKSDTLPAGQPPSVTPENYQLIENLNALVNASNCVLPCWWGLTVGESTLDNLQTLAVANFGETYVESMDGNFIHAGKIFLDSTPTAPYWRLYLGTGFWFRQSDEVLTAVGFSLGYPPGSYVDYSPYLPSGILATYGQPDEATITFFNPEGGYDLTLKYHDLGLYIYYDMFFPNPSTVNPNSGMPICNNDITSMRIWVESNLSEYSTGMMGDLWNTFKVRLDIEEDITGISNLSIAEFTQLFSQPDSCFQTLPIDQWVKFGPTPTPTPGVVCGFNPNTTAELITAIQTANGTPEPDTICLAQNGTYSFSAIHSYRNGLPRISSDIKIVGNGATLTRSPSAPQFRFFEVRSTGNLTLENLTLTGGSLNVDDDGGAIFNLGTLTVNEVMFSNNQAGVGGAIASEDGQVTVTDSTFTNNVSTGDGGAIHSEADLLIEASTFTGNTADDAGAVNNDGGNLTVTDSTFTDNSADDGGAIYNDAGIITLSGSTFTNNAGDAGGALDNLDGQAQIDSTTFTGNSASDGGAIRNYGGTITLTTSRFTGNTATDDGGALNNSGGTLTITDTRLENNTATTRGGAIYSNSSGTMSAHNSCISGNSATAVYSASTSLQDFTGNWWGAANGPGGAGPGSGDTVNSKINHANFLTAGCPLP